MRDEKVSLFNETHGKKIHSSEEEDQIVIVYFDEAKLKKFLFTEELTKPKRGILQKFLDPYGDH
jgi:hypothetical protein